MGDEPFLEAALDDRSKVVRRQAAAVLARIPGSRLQGRLSDSAKAIITVQTTRANLLGRSRSRVVLVPPDSFAPAWERDGIEERQPEGIGQRAWWMRQVLSRAGLAVWTERTGMTPDAILDSLKQDDYFGDAMQALVGAATSAADPAWSAALIRLLRHQPSIDIAALAGLLAGLPDDQRESLALETVTTARLDAGVQWILFASFDRPWSPAFSAAAMKTLGALAGQAPENVWRFSGAIEAASRRISPDALEAFENAVARSFPGASMESVTKHVERVRLRADMQKEFRR